VTGLGGTGRLADDLYLLAHHETTGKPHLQPRAAGLGLAGALLAELMLAGRIRCWRGLIIPAGGGPPADDLSQQMLSLVASERAHRPPRDWLLYLARTATGEVALRLARAGYLTPARGRRFGPGARWVPVDPDSAFAPLVRVKSALRSPGLDAQHTTLAALAAASGLSHHLAGYLPPHAQRRLSETAGRLDPSLRELIAQTQAAVDSALLSHRV
jgi:Golgi phosphoprotein 3 GPP34